MQTLDPMVLFAVFQEMLGPLLWVLILASLGATLAFAALLVKEKGLVAKRLVRAEIAGVFGGALALVLMAKVSSSGFTDAGGPADWFGGASWAWMGQGSAAVWRDEGVYPIRPERVALSEDGRGLPAEVEDVQYQGRELHCTLRFGETILRAYRPSDSPVVSGVRVWVNPA